MKSVRFNIEFGLVFLVFLAALLLRIINLAQPALTENEALRALQMFSISKGNDPGSLFEPAIAAWGAGLFFLFGSSEALARIIPAVVGSLLVFAPLLFRNILGKTSILALAIFLAFDPGLISISRQVDGRILALTFSILAFGFYWAQMPVWTGLMFGLALLGGPSFWLGALIFASTWGIYLLIGGSSLDKKVSSGSESGVYETTPFREQLVKKAFPWFAGTLVFGGSLFLLVPAGWSAIAGSFYEFLRGGTLSSGSWFNLSSILIYSPLAVLLGILGAVRCWPEHGLGCRLVIFWFLCGLLVVSLYQGHQTADLVWVITPLWVLAAKGLDWILVSLPRERLVVLFSIFIFILMVFGGLNFIAAQNLLGDKEVSIRYFSTLGAAFLIVSGFVLVTWGWDWKFSTNGLVCGIGFFLALATFANSMRAAGTGPRPDMEMWSGGAGFQDADLFVRSVGDVSEWNTGRRDWLDIQVSGVELISIKWLLRNQFHQQFTSGLTADANPAMLVTPEQSSLPLKAQYSGQDFMAYSRPSWHSFSTGDWVKWIIFREAPKEQGSVILWVRSDLFPGNPKTTNSSTP